MKQAKQKCWCNKYCVHFFFIVWKWKHVDQYLCNDFVFYEIDKILFTLAKEKYFPACFCIYKQIDERQQHWLRKKMQIKSHSKLKEKLYAKQFVMVLASLFWSIKIKWNNDELSLNSFSKKFDYKCLLRTM